MHLWFERLDKWEKSAKAINPDFKLPARFEVKLLYKRSGLSKQEKRMARTMLHKTPDDKKELRAWLLEHHKFIEKSENALYFITEAKVKAVIQRIALSLIPSLDAL
jgi:hypothetical protein